MVTSNVEVRNKCFLDFSSLYAGQKEDSVTPFHRAILDNTTNVKNMHLKLEF